jgi:thiol-disulfide isomerase/thioredoxin
MKKSLIIGAAVGIVVIAAVLLFMQSNQNIGSKNTKNITVGSKAPDYNFLLDNGSYANLSRYKGHTTLLWFVATWCSTCAQGNQAVNQNYQFFKSHGIKIVELEMYNDLGYPGPAITNFVSSYAPNAYSNNTLIPALSGYNMTARYDPNGYLDIYYLISSNGTVLYINGSPASTLGQLEGAINSSL